MKVTEEKYVEQGFAPNLTGIAHFSPEIVGVGQMKKRLSKF
jgi:hypothetical protein